VCSSDLRVNGMIAVYVSWSGVSLPPAGTMIEGFPAGSLQVQVTSWPN